MKVAPSILSADFADLKKSVATVDAGGADMIHCDIMDGVFVPNISFGFPVVKAVRKITELPLDVHLMIVEPDKYINQVRDCGADIMNVHYEACTHLNSTVSRIHTAGMKAAVTLNPSTPVELLVDIIEDVDMVLLMSVNPGFGGQSFIPHTCNKIRRLRQLIDSTSSSAIIEIDGGINLQTGKLCAEAGADVLVAGSAVFSNSSPANIISYLKSL